MADPDVAAPNFRMPIRPFVLLRAIVLLFVIGCTRPRTAMEMDVGFCGIPVRGETGLTRRNSPTRDATAQASRLGSMMLHVTGDDPVRALSKPFVDVLSDTTALNRTPAIRSGVGDTLGRLRFDSMAAGRYGLLVRRLGYEILRRVIEVRPGGVDTLFVTLRTQVMCHAP